MLIKGDLPGDHVRTSIDLVGPGRHWHGAFTALAGWYVHELDVPARALRQAPALPSTGPGLHLHTGISWFGVPACLHADC